MISYTRWGTSRIDQGCLGSREGPPSGAHVRFYTVRVGDISAPFTGSELFCTRINAENGLIPPDSGH
jgi:hypothetical protein